MNHGTFAGRLGRDAEMRSTPSGHAVLNFSVAVDIGFGDKKETLWIACALWGDRGEKLQPYLTKGKSLTVAGDVGIRQYTTQGGEARAEITLNVQRVTLQGGGDRQQGEQAQQQRQAPASQRAAPAAAAVAPDFDDDIPF